VQAAAETVDEALDIADFEQDNTIFETSGPIAHNLRLASSD
jgi:hypothetical protein